MARFNFLAMCRNHDIGGPDGFYFGEAFIRASQNLILSRNLSINALYSISVFDNFDELRLESDSVLPHVRTDIIKYLKGGRGFSITRLQADYIVEPFNDIYFKLSGGLHEEMFGGLGNHRPDRQAQAWETSDVYMILECPTIMVQVLPLRWAKGQ